jgi:hypothetical protein
MSDDRTKIYLGSGEIHRLKSGRQIHLKNYIDCHISHPITLEYVNDENNESFQDNLNDERYDSALDALEEVDDLLWHLTRADESVDLEDILRLYNWKKVMRTYEYYDEIRKQYE